MGLKRVGQDWATFTFYLFIYLFICLGFAHSSIGKESACNSGDSGSIPGLGRSPGEGNGNPFQYSCLENPMDRGAWQAIVHGVAISWTWLSECQRTGAFELWCWRRLLRVPWIARRSNESILKEISPWCSSERMMLKLKLQYFGRLTGKVVSLEDSYAGRDRGQEEKAMTEDEMAGWHHWLDGRDFEWTPGVSDGQGGLVCCDSWGCKELDTTEWLNWTEIRMKGSSL